MAYLRNLGGWLVSSVGLLVGGFALLGAAGTASGWLRAGEEVGAVPGLWRLLFRIVLAEALLPQLLLTLSSWLLLARLLPALERSWRGLLPGVPALAALWFPLVGEYGFRSWTPTTPADYANTLLLLSAAVGVALLLPRRVLPFLAPGVFAAGPHGTGRT